MTVADAVAGALFLALAALVVLVLRACWRRRPSYQGRGRFGRMVVLLASLAVTFLVATWLPVLVLRFVPPVGTSFMVQRMLPCRGVVYYQWVPWERLSRHTPIAFVAAEDQRFPQHHGFDVEAIREVMDGADGGRPSRGASTISQQVAKNLFLWPGRTWVRKGLEAWWTVLLEVTWPKRRILEVYVNTAQLGPCTFGVGAAARQFFGKDAGELGPWESALLAAVLPSPARSRVESPSAYVRGRQAWISRQVRSLGGSEYLDSGR